MQVGKSETVCIVHDDGIGIADVDAVLHDGCGEEHIIIVVHEPHHHLLQFFRFHLSVTYSYSRIRNVSAYHIGNLRQVADAVVHEEYLSVAAHLEVYCILYDI